MALWQAKNITNLRASWESSRAASDRFPWIFAVNAAIWELSEKSYPRKPTMAMAFRMPPLKKKRRVEQRGYVSTNINVF